MVNEVTLIGNLGKDPETRAFDGGKVLSFSVATTENWKDKNSGEWQQKTEWHNVSVFGGSVDYLADKLKKGMRVYVSGKITTRKWQDKSGQDRYTTSISARTVKPLLPKKSADSPFGDPAVLESDDLPF